MEDPQADVAAIAEEILGYLQANPEASDTVEGVQRWWLSRRSHDPKVEDVRRALDHLVAHGFVSRRGLADGSSLYSAPKLRADGPVQ